MTTRLGVLGGGRMATGLATLLADAGYDIVRSRRLPSGSTPDGPSPVVSFAEAAHHGDIVVMAVTHEAVPHLAAGLGNALDGKVVIDVTNAVAFVDGRLRSGLPDGVSEGQWLSSLLPRTRVTRAFNHIQDEMLVSRARRQPGLWGVAVAGDDGGALDVTRAVVEAAGYVPVDAGTLQDSRVIDPGGPVFPHMFTPRDLADVLESRTLPGLSSDASSRRCVR